MNLVAKEFVALQPDQTELPNYCGSACSSLADTSDLSLPSRNSSSKARPGCLVLSEFAGAAQELYNSFIVNPYDVKDVAEAIHKALLLSPHQKITTNAEMRKR